MVCAKCERVGGWVGECLRVLKAAVSGVVWGLCKAGVRAVS